MGMDGSQPTVLSGQERDFWFAWKRSHEVVRTRIADDVTAATGLSDPDISVLIRVYDAGGVLRQNALAGSLGWDRTRLSHHLTRMEARGLLSRAKSGTGMDVMISDAGREAVTVALPVHAAAVRRHLMDPFGADLDRFMEVLHRLAG